MQSSWFKFSWRVTLVCSILIIGMLSASRWQWHRHLWKQKIIETLDANLNLPITSILSIVPSNKADWANLIHRRVSVSGEYDFEHEFTLRNRRLQDAFAGVHVITPLKIADSNPPQYVLVDRGFVPLAKSSKDLRSQYQKSTNGSFTGLIKDTMPRKIFSPADPEAGPGLPWVDAWLRVDIENIQKQLPYTVPPVYLEIMENSDAADASEKIQNGAKDGRNEIFMVPQNGFVESHGMDAPDLDYPVPDFDTIIPPARHLGYVYEWASMALMTFCIGLVLQLRRRS